MIDEPDFSIEGEDSPPVEQPTATPAPKVIIEYRDRGFSTLLVPPLLILLAALGILASRRETPILVPPPAQPIAKDPGDPKSERPTSTEPASRETAVATAPNKAFATTESQPPSPSPNSPAIASALPELPDLDELMPPATASAGTAPAPADRHVGNDSTATIGTPPDRSVTEKPVAAREVESERPRKPVPIGRPLEPPALVVAKPEEPPAVVADPPVDPVAAAPVPADVTKDQVLAEIRDEAARKAAEIRKIEELKPQVRFLEISRVIKKAEANRVPFHKAIRELLKSRRPRVGQDIEALCNEYGRTTLPEIRTHIGKILSTTYARSTLKVKVEMMRAWGYPETMIFDYVANGIDRQLGTPGGPRDGDEVRVRAARLLIAMPPSMPGTRSVAGSAPLPSSANGQRPH